MASVSTHSSSFNPDNNEEKVQREEEDGPLIRFCQRFETNDPTLSICNLHYITLGMSGSELLAKALSSSSSKRQQERHLLVLFADGCEIGEFGAQLLFSSFQYQTSLRHLYMSYNHFGSGSSSSMKALSDTLLSTTSNIQILKLTHNQIGNAGAKALSNALKENPSSLQELDLHGNQIQVSGQCALAESLRTNTNLISLDLARNLRKHHHHNHRQQESFLQDRLKILQTFCNVLKERNNTIQNIHLDSNVVVTVDGVVSVSSSRAQANKLHSSSLLRCTFKQMEYYLALNRLGRHSFGEPSIPIAAWSRVLSKAATRGKRHNNKNGDDDSGDLVYAILQAKPDLLVTSS